MQPARDTLERLIITQPQKARQFIYETLLSSLTEEQCASIEKLLKVDDSRFSNLQQLKQAPAKPSPKALITLTRKLELIQSIGIASLDISWLNNNYQRSLAKYVMPLLY